MLDGNKMKNETGFVAVGTGGYGWESAEYYIRKHMAFTRYERAHSANVASVGTWGNWPSTSEDPGAAPYLPRRAWNA